MSAKAAMLGYDSAAQVFAEAGQRNRKAGQLRDAVVAMTEFNARFGGTGTLSRDSDQDVALVPCDVVTDLQATLSLAAQGASPVEIRIQSFARALHDLSPDAANAASAELAACWHEIRRVIEAIEQFDAEAPVRSQDLALWLDWLALTLTDEQSRLSKTKEHFAENHSCRISLGNAQRDLAAIALEVEKAAETEDHVDRTLFAKWLMILEGVLKDVSLARLTGSETQRTQISVALQLESRALVNETAKYVEDLIETGAEQRIILDVDELARVQEVAAHFGCEIEPIERPIPQTRPSQTIQESDLMPTSPKGAGPIYIVGDYKDQNSRPKASWILIGLRLLALVPFAYFYFRLRGGVDAGSGRTPEEQRLIAEAWLYFGLISLGFLLTGLIRKPRLQIVVGTLEFLWWLLLIRMAIMVPGLGFLIFAPGALFSLVNFVTPIRQLLWDRRVMKNVPVERCKRLLTLYGREWGVPGNSLVNSALEDAKIQQGLEGELRSAEILRRLLDRFPGLIVIHSAPWPGKSTADIDHMLLSGEDFLLVDSKMWQPGTYTQVDGPGIGLVLLRDDRPFKGNEIKIGDARIRVESMLRRVYPRVLGGNIVAIFSESGPVRLDVPLGVQQMVVAGEDLENTVAEWIMRNDQYQGTGVVPALVEGLRTYWETDGEAVSLP